MLCISIAQESRKLAIMDMFNAAPQCDLLEVRLDRFEKAPDLAQILSNKPKPVIMSCRRLQDGGDFQGSEDERLALLRQCIISKADYVEIELDVADEVRRYPPAQRVISYTNLAETPDDIADIYAEACSKHADVVKLVTAARTPEEAWPLVQILSKQRVPTVVVGVGKPGVMLTVLGKRMGAPWTYAALERGMETYPGQPTVQDLEQVYHYRAIERGTRFVGVTGFDAVQRASVAVLNAAFAQLGLSARCLPLQVGELGVFRKVMDIVRLAGVVVDEPNRGTLCSVAGELEPFAKETQAADLLLKQNEAWQGFDTLGRAAVAALEAMLQERGDGDRPLNGKHVMIVGVSPTAKSLACAVKYRGGVILLASRHRQAATRLALELSCRIVPFDAMYGTSHDVLIVCDDEKKAKPATGSEPEGSVHRGILKPGNAVLDLTAMPLQSELGREAMARGCAVVSPRAVLLEQLRMQVKSITGKQVPREQLQEVLQATIGEEE